MDKAAVFCFTSNERDSYSCAIHRPGFLFSMVWHVSDLRLPCCLDRGTLIRTQQWRCYGFPLVQRTFYSYLRDILKLYLMTPAYIYLYLPGIGMPKASRAQLPIRSFRRRVGRLIAEGPIFLIIQPIGLLLIGGTCESRPAKPSESYRVM